MSPVLNRTRRLPHRPPTGAGAEAGRTPQRSRAPAALAALAGALTLGAGLLATPASAAPGARAEAPPGGAPGLERPLREAPATRSELRTRMDAARHAVASDAVGRGSRDGSAANSRHGKSSSGASAGEGPGREASGSPGDVGPFIIGGDETPIADAPWMVQLGYHDADAGTDLFCGGALVAPNKVLTAAHCVAGLDWTANGAVLAGASGRGDNENGSYLGVQSQWNHPRFDRATAKDDIAVLTLNRPFDGRTATLAASDDRALYEPGTQGTAYGWGVTSSGGSLAPTLQSATLPMVADATCDSAMRQVLGADRFVEGSMICAGAPATGADEGTTSPCDGDSGGPLVVNGRIAGIVSWGVEGCTAEGAYPVFSKVSSYTWAAQPRIDDTDLSGDGRADLLARTPSGGLFQQDSTGTGLAQRAFLSHGWEDMSHALQGDFDRDGYQDILIRDDTDGRLYRNYLDHDTWTWEWQRLETVWGGYRSYATPGDLSGDGRPDLVAVDADGSTYLYQGRGDGEFAGRIQVVDGAWKGVEVLGHGDLSGDGKADLLARDSSDTLWLYRGTGDARQPWSARIKARTGWNFTALVTSGDTTGDGTADLLARAADGSLYLYPGTGKASTELFGSRSYVGGGFQQYDLLF